MLETVESHRNALIVEVFNLMNVFLEWKLTSNLQVFTSLLSIYMRRREVGNAVALIGAMEEHGVVQHVKAITTVAFICASRGDLKAVCYRWYREWPARTHDDDQDDDDQDK
uniref:Pentatricopeptide repeat-containing protein n=1 Tax=Peronospora matthiolae TaxID=2874970 RepID=A0AAV1U3Y2_9STRA